MEISKGIRLRWSREEDEEAIRLLLSDPEMSLREAGQLMTRKRTRNAMDQRNRSVWKLDRTSLSGSTAKYHPTGGCVTTALPGSRKTTSNTQSCKHCGRVSIGDTCHICYRKVRDERSCMTCGTVIRGKGKRRCQQCIITSARESRAYFKDLYRRNRLELNKERIKVIIKNLSRWLKSKEGYSCKIKNGRRNKTTDIRLAKMVYKMAGIRKCYVCGYDQPRIMQVHHILPVKNNGTDGFSNLAMLCPNCHVSVHRGLLTLADDCFELPHAPSVEKLLVAINNHLLSVTKWNHKICSFETRINKMDEDNLDDLTCSFS